MVVSLLRWYVQFVATRTQQPPNLTFLRYNGRLAARPLLTQSITTAVLFATGDITAQQLVEKKGLEKHDLTRTGRMALYGGGTLSASSKLT